MSIVQTNIKQVILQNISNLVKDLIPRFAMTAKSKQSRQPHHQFKSCTFCDMFTDQNIILNLIAIKHLKMSKLSNMQILVDDNQINYSLPNCCHTSWLIFENYT